MATVEDRVLLEFFEYLFEHDEGYVSICTTRPPARRDTFHEEFFEWPARKQDMVEYIDKVTPTHNVYFGINVLSVPRRKKDNTIPQNLLWADLDSCRPDQLEIPPQCVIESSPNRYQAVWRLDRKVDPFIAENYSKRLAYHYAKLGVDTSGYDLTQLLRVPGTFNFKYLMDEAPKVRLLANVDDVLPVEVFDALPQATDSDVDVPNIDVPDIANLPTIEMILYRLRDQLEASGLASAFARYYSEEPPSDWSAHLWRLILICFEVGMTAEETFVVTKHSKSNKYERDGRPDSHLWREILKAELERKAVDVLLQEHRYLTMPALLSKREEDGLERCLIDDYMEWASEVTDAVPEFHEISCAVVMSALMSTTLRLRTQRNQSLVPNIWAMILGESTLTRKSTAMDMAMDFVMDIDRNLIIASDATVEGLISNLALRPKMVSIFYRDEVSGFFDSMLRKDYLAGMHETMTKMYDVPKYLVRRLKKETFVVSEPIFIFFGGGVPGKMYSLIDESYFASGFIPRFLVMRGHSDLSRVRPTGPPTELGMDKRAKLHNTFQALWSIYTNQEIVMEVPTTGEKMVTTPEVQVIFTPEMWERMAKMEMQLLAAADESPENEKALPVFSRMYVSMQKLTMLFAAARQEPVDLTVRAEMKDLLKAAWYIQKWGRHAVDLIRNSGVTADESKLMGVYRTIERHPGMLRGQVMQRHRLNSREIDIIETTLSQRMMIQIQNKGRAKAYWPIGR